MRYVLAGALIGVLVAAAVVLIGLMLFQDAGPLGWVGTRVA
jgi:hypothetical protein